jgi:glycosyltransferase involved in cell wall biosynthesis
MNQPLVTLGMPVYNEEKFIAESLDNLFKQTYPNLEIIIGDNGSTDSTPAICREYAARHANINYIQHPKNIGQPANFNHLALAATGKYFCWVAAHDLLDKDFVEKSVAVLESDPSIVLAYPRTMNMLADGTFTREKVRPFDITKMPPGRRFREVMWRVDCNYVYGTFRTMPMQKGKLFQLFPAADRVFLAEMAVKGTFAPVDTFKYYRLNRGLNAQTEIQKRHRLMAYLYPDKKFTDAELEKNSFYAPTARGFHQVVRDAGIKWPESWVLHGSVWLAGVVKSHLFPGADVLSVIVKKILPKPVLNKILAQMQ